MGLFDKRDSTKKKKDDFDSPVEQIDLSAPPAAAEPMAAAPSAAASSTSMRQPELEPEPDPEPPPSRYGINDAIELMRALPPDNIELVVQVVKRTLESTNVKVATIIDDASKKQKRIEDRIAVLKGEIADFEKEIDTRRGEIGSLESDHEETSTVKERLQLAEKLAPNGAKKPASGGVAKPAPKTSDTGASASGTMGSRAGSAAPSPVADKSKTTIVAKK